MTSSSFIMAQSWPLGKPQFMLDAMAFIDYFNYLVS